MILRDMEKLTMVIMMVCGTDTTDEEQLILPKKLIPLVFTELHVKIRHLHQDHTLQLIGD